jgi:polyphosphate kinase
LVVRREGSTIRRYCHIGTGNYNPKTARLYEDVGLLTAAPDIGADLTDLFNSLTGYSRKESYRNLLVAPYGVRKGIIERIEREITATREGAEGRIRVKANALWTSRLDALRAGRSASRWGARMHCGRTVDTGEHHRAPRSGRFFLRALADYSLRAIDEFLTAAPIRCIVSDRRVEVMASVKGSGLKSTTTFSSPR